MTEKVDAQFGELMDGLIPAKSRRTSDTLSKLMAADEFQEEEEGRGEAPVTDKIEFSTNSDKPTSAPGKL